MGSLSDIVCVCGAGTMGSGIAQLAAQSGFHTILYDLNETILAKARNNIGSSLSFLISKGRISEEEKSKITGRISFTNDIRNCIADIFIEAIIEKAEAKTELFNRLSKINRAECVFASNTSSLSVTRIAEQISNPERMIGMHFFNPAHIMKLVEVVNTNYTNEQTTQIVIGLAKKMNKTPVVCKDSPGFIVNRVARPYYIESLRMAEEGAGLSQIDLLMEAAGFKMGPFRLMDLIGNDVNYEVSCSVYEQMGRPERLRPSVIQEQKVKEKKLGKKTGEGYYKY
ncbi:MAG: 3-hydroxybutyryl-CoA dehydrogenase [Chitinophagaceae bacterium]|jgi:3-hydroxybutyryl-CoA dehydrogenase|nr:3-hydroxybutyryl-CoA dehydrogenase [Chitinophagaceae bacterium]OQY95154.1 MAG: 3-hydroxybutyryl-CoA dehydrogenase [Sphingobacteriales bacterium UTBCD1]